jgi:hypothetical protein
MASRLLQSLTAFGAIAIGWYTWNRKSRKIRKNNTIDNNERYEYKDLISSENCQDIHDKTQSQTKTITITQCQRPSCRRPSNTYQKSLRCREILFQCLPCDDLVKLVNDYCETSYHNERSNVLHEFGLLCHHWNFEKAASEIEITSSFQQFVRKQRYVPKITPRMAELRAPIVFSHTHVDLETGRWVTSIDMQQNPNAKYVTVCEYVNKLLTSYRLLVTS